MSGPVFKALLDLTTKVGEHPDAMFEGAPLNAAFIAASKVLQEHEPFSREEGDWRPMVSAPLDGTEIEVLMRHHTYWTALKVDGKEEADRRWQGIARAKWIDHNGGGWTWHGISGSPMGWRPITQ